MKSKILFQMIVIVLATPITGSAQSRQSNWAAVDTYLEQVVTTTRIPGVVALVTDSKNIIYSGAFGMQNAKADIPMSTETVFNLASMTKPIAATAIMMLVEDGKLDLDDPISKYLPEYADKTVILTLDAENGAHTSRPASQEITIRHLMSHSSGLAYGFSSDTVFRLNGGKPVDDNSDLPLLYDPGTGWAYGTGIGIVATVLETISGQTLDVFLKQRLFEPLGMTDTTYVVPPNKTGRVATVHYMTDDGLVEEPVPNEVQSTVSGNVGLYSTAADYAKFIQLFLNKGVASDGSRLLDENTIRIMGENQIGSVRVSLQDEPAPWVSRAFPLGEGRDRFGIGFQITGPHQDATIRSPGSLSWAGLFNTQFWIDQNAGVGAVLLMQYLPFYDEEAIATLIGFEKRVYKELPKYSLRTRPVRSGS